MIAFLVRVPSGWAAYSDAGAFVAVAPLNLVESCAFFGVRRTMFGQFTTPDSVKREAWTVRPLILDQQQQDT